MSKYVGATCEVICEDNGRKMVADVLYYTKHKTLTVSIDRNIKLTMPWNGRLFEGFLGDKSFITDGPGVYQVTQGREGRR
jgi:hypothetical protein